MTQGILVDTHILLWARLEPERLTPAERQAIDLAPRRCLSAASLWEIAILMAAGRVGKSNRLLDVPEGFELLPILPSHALALLDLPFRHRDPFDRMLIAQAGVEQLELLTRDAAIARYKRQPR
jgi:PIN domain nuclease of toxin-antitoxin system